MFFHSSVRQIPRKLALLLLKEARVLGNLVAKVTTRFLFYVAFCNTIIYIGNWVINFLSTCLKDG